MDEQFVKVDERFAQVDQRFTQLQILGEDNASNIKLVAEVLAHHGTVLDQIKEACSRWRPFDRCSKKWPKTTSSESQPWNGPDGEHRTF